MKESQGGHDLIWFNLRENTLNELKKGTLTQWKNTNSIIPNNQSFEYINIQI